MALSKKDIKDLIGNSLAKYHTDIFEDIFNDHTHNYAGSSSAGGAATSANKVNKSLVIQTNGTQKASWNGSADTTVNITASSIGAAAASHGTHVIYSETTPKAASPSGGYGTSSTVARGDHSHPEQTTISGNAGTATKLATARNIGRASFNGASDITLEKIMGECTIKSSGSTNKNKYIKFGSIDISTGTYNNCCSKLFFISTESNAFSGILNVYARTGAAVSSVSLSLKWESITNSDYESSVVLVKTEDGKFDLYFKPVGDYCTMNVSLISSGPNKITLASDTAYVATVTAVATSSIGAVVNKVANSLTIQTNGTDAAIFDGSTAKSVNITASSIGAASSSHDHNDSYYTKGEIDTFAANFATTGHGHGLSNSNFTVELASTTTDNGWSMIEPNYNQSGFWLKSIRGATQVPNWFVGSYSSGIAFGGSDTKGVMSVLYSAPKIKFAGGAGTKPAWNMEITGTTDKSYNLDNYISSDKVPKSGAWFNGFTQVTTDGVMETGKYVDFHNSNTSTADYNVRLACNSTTTGIVTALPTKSGTLALTSDITDAIGDINSILDDINGVSL